MTDALVIIGITVVCGVGCFLAWRYPKLRAPLGAAAAAVMAIAGVMLTSRGKRREVEPPPENGDDVARERIAERADTERDAITATRTATEAELGSIIEGPSPEEDLIARRKRR